MHDYQRDFIELTLQREVLRFGEFTLKSGRQSPYFFNMGRIDSGAALAQLGRNGVPVYVFYKSGRAPVVLSEVLSVDEVRSAIARL